MLLAADWSLNKVWYLSSSVCRLERLVCCRLLVSLLCLDSSEARVLACYA